MDASAVTTVASAIGILVGVYAIVNRTEDRIGKRIEDAKELLKLEIKAEAATIRKEMTQMESRLNERIETRIVRG